MIRRITCEWG